MKPSEWQKISAARHRLGLGERATLKEMKDAFREKSKQHHPDLASDREVAKEDMCTIYEAYEVLSSYMQRYKFPLTPEESNEPLEAEDWWMERFGQDPLWGKEQE